MVNEQDEIQLILNDRFGISNADNWFQEFVERIDYLVQTDFPKLVHALYTLDVSETKLSGLLKEHTGIDAAEIIARLIIERQREKIHSRNQHRKPGDDIPESEKW